MFNCFYTRGLPRICSNIEIFPIFKKGDKLDPTNYRAISVMNVFTKLYSTILN